jgi:CheY-like chemotaxis protein
MTQQDKTTPQTVSGHTDVLLVEDDPNDVEFTLHALKSNHLINPVHVVRDGAEALEFLFRTGRYADRPPASGPKVVLLDLKLPKVDGLEVLERVRSDPTLQNLPVVMLTSSREERDVIESYQLGANSYIVKPVDFDRFTEAVRTVGLYWLLLNRPPVPSTADRQVPDPGPPPNQPMP